MSKIASLAGERFRNMDPYVPGVQPSGGSWIKLNTNELPYPPSPRVAEAINTEIPRLSLYPNPRSFGLREAIAEREQLSPEQVIIGNGSDDLLNLLARVFGSFHQSVGQTFPGYSLYPVLTTLAGGALSTVEFSEFMELPVDDLISLNANIIFLTSPNAPTGVAFPQAKIKSLAQGVSGLLVVDEAYVDFAKESSSPLLKDCPNLVITRTFSKSYGLAGLRVGYAMAHREVIELLDRVRDCYNVDRLSQAGALAAYQDQTYLASVVDKVKATRTRFCEALDKLGWRYYRSQTNFIFTQPERAGRSSADVAESLFEFLKEHQILVRYFRGHQLTDTFLRISIGSDHQMDQLLKQIEQWQSNA